MHHACFSLPESSMIFFNSSTARDKKNDEKIELEVREISQKKKEPAQLSYSYQASWL